MSPNYNQSNLLIEIAGETGRGYYFEDYDEDGIFKGAFSENSIISKDLADDENGSTASGFEYFCQDTQNAHNLTGKRDLAGHLLSNWVYNDTDQAIENINTKGTGASINYDNIDEIAVTNSYGLTRIYSIE